MKIPKILSVAITALTFSSPVVAEDTVEKIGTVDMAKLVGDYYKAEIVRSKFKGYEEEVNKENEERIEKIKSLIEEAREFQKQGDKSSLEAEAKDLLFKKAGAKNQEAQALANERIAWIRRKQAAVVEAAAVDFKNLKNEITKIVQQVGKDQGYDFILDRSGSSGAQVPILSFAKDATDMTAALLQILNKDALENPEKEGEGSDAE